MDQPTTILNTDGGLAETAKKTEAVMLVRQAEGDASRVLAASWWSTPWQDSPTPIGPFRLAEKLGIRVRYAGLPADESGNITITGSGSEITLNRGDSTNRRRFTCAHEIGHYYRRLESGEINQKAVFVDRRAQLASAGQDQDEIYANQFAAALLMPAHLVQSGRQDGQTPEILARRFGTSVQAMNLRLINLNLA